MFVVTCLPSLAPIALHLEEAADLKLRSEGESYFNYFIWDAKSDGRHTKQVSKYYCSVYSKFVIKLTNLLKNRFWCSLICWHSSQCCQSMKGSQQS